MTIIKRALAALLVWTGLAAAAWAQPLVDTNWVAANIDNDRVVLIDLRNSIDEGSYETFLEGHIPGSIHSDYGKDGWRVARGEVVGLLPSEEQFESLARRLGVSSDSHVVLVPAGVGASDFGSSARAYWTFKVYGHNDVSILNGGYAAWRGAHPDRIRTGAPVTPAQGDFEASFRADIYASMDDVAGLVGNEGEATLLDARNEEQHYGEAKHPKAAKHGRIPGAQLLFQETAYDLDANRLKSADELNSIYAGVDSDLPVVSYCNTGHWAATNWFVLSEVLGRDNVRLYDGSMVEWTSDAGNPVATGKTNLQKIRGFFKGILG